MVTIFLCDKQKHIMEKFAWQIQLIAQAEHIETSILFFASGEEMLFYMADSSPPDIIYLETLLEPNGLEIARRLRANDCKAEIIFLTDFPNYVFESFDVQPLYYLLKHSISRAKFKEVFLHAVERCSNKEKELFTCMAGKTRMVIPVQNIYYFEIWKRILCVHYQNNQSFEFYGRMADLEIEMRKKGFVRVHRSYLVNLLHIITMGPQSVKLRTGTVLPLGAVYAKQAENACSRYIAQSLRQCAFRT